MAKKGIIRKLDPMGRIVVPKEFRRSFNMENDKDSFEITMEDDKIVMRKFVPDCIFCNSSKNIVEYGEYVVCGECIEKLQSLKEAEEENNV